MTPSTTANTNSAPSASRAAGRPRPAGCSRNTGRCRQGAARLLVCGVVAISGPAYARGGPRTPYQSRCLGGQWAGAVMASQPTRRQVPGGEADVMTATTSTEGSGPVARRLAPAAARRLPATAGPAIQVAGLRKKFGCVMAVDDVSFTVSYGRITGFLGPNGAGKTTTLRMMLGLIRPDAGTAAIAGKPYPNLASPAQTVGALLGAAAHAGRS